MRSHGKAVSAESNSGAGIRRAIYGRTFATRSASSCALLLALVFALALAASPAKATFVQSASWPVTGNGSDGAADGHSQNVTYSASFDIAPDLGSGDVFTSYLQARPAQPNSSNDDPGRLNKWAFDGTPGTPALFGNAFSAASNYAGVAIDPTTHNVYALVDPIDRSNNASPADPKITIFQPDGTLLGSFSVSTNEPVGIDVDASGHVYVPDPANGVVNEYDGAVGSGTFGNLLDTTAGSTLSDPTDIALDASGNLYVADKSTNRVNEHQALDLQGNHEGSFRLGFDGAHTGVDFTGDVDYVQGTGDLVQAEGTADRSLLANATGDTQAGNTTITNVTGVSGTFTVGESISSGEPGSSGPIPFGTTITALGAGTITMSAPADSTATGLAIASGSKVLTNVTNIGEFKIGMGINPATDFSATPSPGIPYKAALFGGKAYVTTITDVDTGNDTISLSDGVLSAGSGESITGEYIVNAHADSGNFAVGELLKGPFNFGVYPAQVTSVSGGTIVTADVFPPGNTPGAALEGSSPVIRNVDVTGGRFTTSLNLFGAGQADNTTVDSKSWNPTAKTVTVTRGSVFDSPFSQGGTDVSFHADLTGTSFVAFENALAALPTITAAGSPGAGGIEWAFTSPIELEAGPAINFQRSMGGRNLPQVTCAPGPGAPLTGGTGDCSVSTAQDGGNTPGRVAKFDSNLDFTGNFVPPSTNYTADAIAVDKSTGDVYVAGGNSDWANPHGVLSGPDVPDFSVKRYDSGGNELEQVGLGTLTASTYEASSNGASALPPAFGLGFDSSSGKLYTVGRATDLTYSTHNSIVRVFSPGHTLTVDPEGTGTGTVDADHGAIADCSKSGGTCSDAYVVGDEVTLHATKGALSDFSGWSVEGEPSACPGTGDCTVTMDADTTVHATFTQTEENLSVLKEGAGTGTVTSNPAGIDCGSTCGPVAFSLGGNVELSAAEDPGSVFTGWSGGGCSGTGTCTVALNAPTTVHATFSHAQDLTVVKEGTGTGTVTSTPAGIDCGSTCGPVPFPEGENVELTASTVTADHSTFAGWSGGGCSGTGTCTVTMNAATTVHAKFEHNLQNLTVVKEGTGSITVTSTPAGINCGSGVACGPTAFNEASSVTLHAATNGGHTTFNGWSVTGQPGVCPGTGDCTVTMNAATTVHASSTLRHHDLTVSTAGNGAGTVGADSGVIAACTSGPPAAGTCTENDVEGSSVVLTATHGAHSNLAGWSVTGQPGACPGTGTCTVSLDADTNVTATFTLDKQSLTVAKSGSGSGSVTCDGGACASSYDYGSTVTLAASAASGSHFTGWSGACSGAGTCTVTIDGDKSVTAGFDANPVVTPTCATDPSLCPKNEEKPLHCRKGFKKKKVHGTFKCVKVKKHRHHRH